MAIVPGECLPARMTNVARSAKTIHCYTYLYRRSTMATHVILPALGMSQDTGKIVQWLKAEGEQVTKGEPLVEIETDKATVEIEAPADGMLTHIAATAGDDVPVGQVIASILTPGEVSLAPPHPFQVRTTP